MSLLPLFQAKILGGPRPPQRRPTVIYVWIWRAKFWTLKGPRGQRGRMGWQNPMAKCLLKVWESFFEGPMLCKLVRAKLAWPQVPAKFKRSMAINTVNIKLKKILCIALCLETQKPKVAKVEFWPPQLFFYKSFAKVLPSPATKCVSRPSIKKKF